MSAVIKNPAGRLALFLLLLASGCNDRTLRSRFTASPPRIDGDLTEWRDVPVALSDDRTVAVGALHDFHFLYVAVRCASRQKLRQADRRGITVWIDPEGGNRKDLELHYPASRFAQPDPSRGGFWEAMSDSEKEAASRKLDEMRSGVLVIDKRSLDSRIFSSDSGNNFAAAMASSGGIISFEARIPLRLDEYFKNIPPVAEGKRVGIGVSLIEGGNLPPGADREGMGPMGFPRSGRFGGGSRRAYPGRMEADNESEMWVEIDLTKSP